MSWIALTLSGKLLDGIDTTTFGYLRDQTLETDEETDEGGRFDAARNKLRLLLQDAKYLGTFAAGFGLDTFFDALAANAQLTNDIQQALAHTYAWLQFAHDSNSPGDINEVRAERQRECVVEILRALSTSVPVVLGATDKAPNQPHVSGYTIVQDTRGRTDFGSSDVY